jgi:predicted DNA-binding transcriptional regulator AlpA
MTLLSITQISKMTGKSRQWIWFLIRTGQLKAEKVGSQFVVNDEDMKELNKSNNNQKKSEV